MNARAVETHPELQAIEQRTALVKVLEPASAQTLPVHEIAAEATLYGWDDAVESRTDFIKGIKPAYTLAWRHGGLNE